MLYSFHEEYTDALSATAERAFEHLDDQTRLASHMSKRSWKMGWSKFEIRLDALRGKAVGAHIVLAGRVLGVPLYLDEVVVRREPPLHKEWETVGEPRLLVIGAYRMGFDLTPQGVGSKLRVFIDYALPARGVSRLLGKLFGRSYARWCTKRMVMDAMTACARERQRGNER